MPRKSKKTESEFDKAMNKLKESEPRNDAETLIKRARSLPNIPNYEKYLNRGGLFKVKPEFIPNSGFTNTHELRKWYYELIKEKTLKDDEELMNEIIKFRLKILKHRISCEVGLYEKGGLIAGIKIYTILIEDGQDVVDYWIGKTIDPSGFSRLVNDLHSYLMRKNGVGTINITHHPIKWHTVDGITTEFEFA